MAHIYVDIMKILTKIILYSQDLILSKQFTVFLICIINALIVFSWRVSDILLKFILCFKAIK